MSEERLPVQEDYNKTLNLPETAFSMRAGLPVKEPAMVQQWQKDDLYHEILKSNEGKPLYVLHDGPPYANGKIHMGTAMNKVLKDIIVRYKNMAGFCSPYVPGYDTHGLPIELKALEAAGENKANISQLELRKACRDFALKHVDIMSEEFQRLGVVGDFEHPYLTLAPEFEAIQVKIFGEMAKKGYIYKGLKAVYWCPTDKTALAEAEIEYSDDECDSIYVAFQVVKDNGTLARVGIPMEKTRFVIWTTTTWTLPANLAICLGPDFDYVFVKVGDTYYVMAEALVESTMKACGITDYEVLDITLKGSEFELMEVKHPFLDRNSLLIVGDHVTLDSGTGCVHTAPGHGVEDFEVCQKHYPQIPVICPVDEAGYLTEEAGPFKGLNVLGDANKVILEHIRKSGHLLGVQHMTHQYPHCWRCHNPIIFRATEQWFCSVEAFKEETYKAIQNVNWLPAWGQERITGMVRDRNDWCISRQRTWGVPIPVFYCKKCGKYHITESSINTVAELFKKEGSDAWYKYSADEILHGTEKCSCGCTEFEKDRDIMDVWFDSGSSHMAVLETRPELCWPCDLYIEGGDQYRGWFQSSLLTSVAVRGVAPYKNVISCGWVVDGLGRAMHKSLGNGIAPEEIIKDYGADIIRLWVASSDYQVDVRISKEILKQLSEAYRKIRNTARFILGNLNDFNPDTDRVAWENLEDLDRWALASLDRLITECRAGYDAYDFSKVYHAVHKFCVVDMSNFYLDVIKDRMYVNKADSQKRRAAQSVIFQVLVSLTKLIAPILAFTSQEIWEAIPAFSGKQKYVACEDIDQPGSWSLTDDEWTKWDEIIKIRDDVRKALEEARNAKVIGASLEAEVQLNCSEELYVFAKPLEDQLATLCIVSKVVVAQGDEGRKGDLEGLAVAVSHAKGEKCARCWMYTEDVGSDPEHPTLCARCAAILNS
ncbi:MAG TPA: isoleucine--tRNA ligase [Candidatus Pygmaiobacter gallistercoris]|nr:isoleucine--tRNA ligase [Candidatus Pygmaiobacter gallistercoris]